MRLALTAKVSITKIVSAMKPLSRHVRSYQCTSYPYYNTFNEIKGLSATSEIPLEFNEKRNYGETLPPLHAISLLTYLYLHFLCPDKFGLVDVDTQPMAEVLHCTERTVQNNLRLLSQYGYITCRKGNYPGNHKVFILDYEKMFLPAYKGGKGYLTLSEEFLRELCHIHNINALRFSLRIYMDEILKERKGLTKDKWSFQEAATLLPSYCGNAKIKNILDQETINHIFTISKEPHFFFLKLSEWADPRKMVSKLKQECSTAVKKLIQKINRNAKKNGISFKLYPSDYEDLEGIALTYRLPLILDAVQQIYDQYIRPGLYYKNIGGLIRTICRRNFQYEQSISA